MTINYIEYIILASDVTLLLMGILIGIILARIYDKVGGKND